MQAMLYTAQLPFSIHIIQAPSQGMKPPTVGVPCLLLPQSQARDRADLAVIAGIGRSSYALSGPRRRDHLERCAVSPSLAPVI